MWLRRKSKFSLTNVIRRQVSECMTKPHQRYAKKRYAPRKISDYPHFLYLLLLSQVEDPFLWSKNVFGILPGGTADSCQTIAGSCQAFDEAHQEGNAALPGLLIPTPGMSIDRAWPEAAGI